jgi:hypothetical protein
MGLLTTINRAAAEDAAAEAHRRGWPPLRGTPKQVAWAEQLRLSALLHAEEYLDARQRRELGGGLPTGIRRRLPCWSWEKGFDSAGVNDRRL